MSTVVFLTGGTGFIGTQIARRLIRQPDSHVVVLVRGENKESATLRLKRAWWEWPELTQQVGNRIKVINGDVTQPHCGIENSDYQRLVQNTTHIIHAAANTTPNLSLEMLCNINVKGTANIIELAKEIKRHHGLARLSYISTAYVAGKQKGTINETDLTDQSGFCSSYEQTKYESEVLVSKAKNELPVSVFRPSLVVGDSQTGYVKTFNTVYYLLRLYLTGQLRVVPVNPKFKINLVSVDYVADAVTKLTFDDQAAGLTFHLTAPWKKMPTAQELVGFVRKWAKQSMKINLPKVIFAPSTGYALQGYLQFKSLLKVSDKKTSDAFEVLAPYFSQHQEFKQENTDKLMGEYGFSWREILPNILQHAVYYSFFHRSERTVHEQILFRLQSNAKPVRYHEITKERVISYDTKTVRQEMFCAAAAMKAMGIKKGDVVALVGLNNLRYLIIDVATGLLGAVSSPIYYTSPVSEINKILTETKAKLFFVGIPKVLQEIGSITSDIPVISFCSQRSNTQTPSGVISWPKFLEQAKTGEISGFAPVEFSDLATIRYTYGSTGEPKGACLEHGNIRYVAEALASNFPWKARTTKASYLSFLPMNHVAEGITATYSPYFVPAALDIYYLEDFHELQNALHKAKPTVFFAIPRFYEKVWEELSKNPLGQQYFKTKNGIKKCWLKKALKFSVLRKAGLNKCAQLIVGAACTSETLLQNFQNLGIEIHNAYGLSEAPLVAMNRLGSNDTETVGPPLHNTKICIDHDDEILIKGPQVMRGYLNRENEKSFKEGWFATGDIGEVTSKGHLRIHGRKKNMIITSYGKKIPTDKIEASLKTVEHVKEAIVVGDNKPYCSAVLWVDQQKNNKAIEQSIQELNAELEHPAQIKRWVILDETVLKSRNVNAQIKTNRQELLKQIEKIIETIYSSPTTNNLESNN
ncbi:MAG: AMP-binding protein [Candidatus Bathyarchaeia archaeon]